ncbi:hypothetical protein [Fretibacter rubidus]|uniref:hypothetical protein n=1 Tax=Fretibacter rubidus TaxID=570162 RepID=UPI00352A8FC5
MTSASPSLSQSFCLMRARLARALFARMALWVRLLCGGVGVEPNTVYPLRRYVPSGRAALRVSRRTLPPARRGSELNAIIYRVKGRASYLRHIYDYGLTGRVRWCFTPWNWKWASRFYFMHCVETADITRVCQAPLHPD